MTADRVWIPRSQQPVLLISLDVSSDETGKDRLLYCGSAVFESRLASYAAELFPFADTVIFGSHGPLLKESYGEDLPFSPNCNVILSAYGDAAAWFAPQKLPDGASMWLGQKRFVLLSD